MTEEERRRLYEQLGFGNIPIATTGYTNNVYNKDYINKPIPIVYGEVDRAPAIPWLNKSNESTPNSLYILCDDLLNDSRGLEIGGYGSDVSSEFLSSISDFSSNPLYIYKDDYYQVLEHFNNDALEGGDYGDELTDWQWIDTEQYRINGNIIEVIYNED